MRLTVRTRLSGFRQFFKDIRGASAVEFALISPVMLAMAMMGVSSSFKMLDRQRLDSAVTSTLYYMTDMTIGGDMTGFQPVSQEVADVPGTYETVPGPTIQTAKQVMIDAFKSNATLIIRDFAVDCGCPTSVSPLDADFDPEQPFYTRYNVERVDEAPICSKVCPDRSIARILAEVSVSVQGSDIFGETYEYDKQMLVRLR